jgi:hypothetical protein
VSQRSKAKVSSRRIKVDRQQTELASAIGKLKELRKMIVQRKATSTGYKIFNMELEALEPDEDREIEPSYKLMDKLEQMILNCFSKIDDMIFGGQKPVTTTELEELCEMNNFDEIMENWKNTINAIGEASVTKMRHRLAHIRQMQYADYPKRVYNWLVRDATLMCEIEANVLEEFSMIDEPEERILKKMATLNLKVHSRKK